MIITLTMNPSIDRTAALGGPLQRGGVNRVDAVSGYAGGKGINVASVVHSAQASTLAVVPSPPQDPFVQLCENSGVPLVVVPTSAPVRINLTVTEPDGTTTKINSPGANPGPEVLAAVTETLDRVVSPGDWVALSGSLPAGVPADFYVGIVARLRRATAEVAVDTSDAPLAALAASFGTALPSALLPSLLKPNAEELGQLTGVDGPELERGAENGDLSPVVTAAENLVRLGVGAVLVTLGRAGAVLVTASDSPEEPRGTSAWWATAPPIEVRSTVGAGDSALAGYLLAAAADVPMPERLAWAVAYGSAAAALPGTQLPAGLDLNSHSISITEI